MPEATTPQTIADIEAARGQQMTVIDDIIRTAQERPEGERTLTPEERSEHDAAVAEYDRLGQQLDIERAAAADQDRFAAHEARRASQYPVPNINRLSEGDVARAGRSLDEVLWATAETVATPSGRAVNSVDQVLVRTEDQTIGLAPRISEFRQDHHSLVRSFQSTVAEMVLFGLVIDGSGAHTSKEGFEVARSHPLMRDRWLSVCRAMDVDTSNEGTDWVPTGIGATLHEKVRAEGKIAPLFARINLPTNPWKWPLEGADATAYRVGEPTGDTESKMTASTPGTAAATFDAEIFGARALTSLSLEADSAIAVMSYIQDKLVQAFVAAEEKAILDGDTDGTHQDTDVHALGSTDARWAWDGLRKKALAQTTQATTATSVANLLAIRAAMDKWGINPADLVYIVGPSALHKLIADSNMLTVDKMGPQATILNGMVGSVGGVPVVVSEHVRKDLNASGVHDGITETKTYNLCVNRREWVMGQRMALDVKVDDSIYRETFQRVAVAFMREDFQHIGTAAANDDTSIGYNVTP